MSLSLSLIIFIFMCMSVLLACMFVSQVCAQCLRRPEDNVRSPETGIADSCEQPYGCWELKMGLFGRTVNVFKAEQSLQPLHQILLLSKLLRGPLGYLCDPI